MYENSQSWWVTWIFSSLNLLFVPEMKSRNITMTANFTAEKRPLIPHIIHQIWDTDRVPKDFSEWISSWSKYDKFYLRRSDT